MPAPHDPQHFLPAFMIRVMRAIGNACTHPTWKYVIAASTITIFTVCTYITLFHSQIGEASPGTPLLWPDHEFNTSTAMIGKKFGGVDVFQVYADGDKKDASGDAEPVRRMEELGRFMEANTDLGAQVSVVPFLKAYWATEPLRRPEVVVHPGRFGQCALGAVPAASERRAGLPAPLHDRRWSLREPVLHLSRPQGRHADARRADRRGLRPREPDRRGDRPAREGPGADGRQLARSREVGGSPPTTCSGRCCRRGITRSM